MSTPGTIRIGTRGSPLSMWQALQAKTWIENHHPGAECEIVTIRTTGDRDPDTPLSEMGGTGVFVKELERALGEGRIELAVHSAKDLPGADTDGLAVAAALPRGPLADALVCRGAIGISDLPDGAVVGTSSPRRAAQLRRIRPDLIIKNIRGNVETRLRKVDDGEYDATILAWAGLRRLGLAYRVDDIFSLESMMPAPGQGIVALQCRSGNQAVYDLLAGSSDREALASLEAERSLLVALGAGCKAAVAGYADDFGREGMMMKGRVLSLDGGRMVETRETITREKKPAELGKMVAESLLSRGAGEILES